MEDYNFVHVKDDGDTITSLFQGKWEKFPNDETAHLHGLRIARRLAEEGLTTGSVCVKKDQHAPKPYKKLVQVSTALSTQHPFEKLSQVAFPGFSNARKIVKALYDNEHLNKHNCRFGVSLGKVQASLGYSMNGYEITLEYDGGYIRCDLGGPNEYDFMTQFGMTKEEGLKVWSETLDKIAELGKKHGITAKA